MFPELAVNIHLILRYGDNRLMPFVVVYPCIKSYSIGAQGTRLTIDYGEGNNVSRDQVASIIVDIHNR